MPDFPPFSLSDVDNLSDSDWLDISSNRDTDDNDSVSSRDSDREEADDILPSRRSSRRSSISIGSSAGHDIEAWEGFADSADEGASAATATALAADVGMPGIGSDGDNSEEQRVKDALDQSMISTLSASRTSSLGHPSTAHNSLRDLRLSFPDPLTSSRDELNRSYEAVESPPATPSTSEEDAAGSHEVPAEPVAVEDPGSLATPAVPHNREPSKVFYTPCELAIVLYGEPSAIKWSFVDRLMQKIAAAGGGQLLSTSSYSERSRTRWLHIQGPNGEVRHLAVEDRTGGYDALPVYSYRPSLAIVYLPTTITNLSDRLHNYYLPVLLPSSPLDLTGEYLEEAEDSWDTLAIPSSKMLDLKEDGTYPIFNSDDLDKLEPAKAHSAFERLSALKRKPARVFSDQFRPVQAVTIFALVSLVVGLAVNSGMRSAAPTPAPTPRAPEQPSSTNNFWSLFAPVANYSVTAPVSTAPAVANFDLVPSSLKDYALAVFNPAPTPYISAAKIPAHSPVTAGKKRACIRRSDRAHRLDAKSHRWAGLRAAQELALIPAALRLAPPPVPAPATSATQDAPAMSALSVRLPGALAERASAGLLVLRRDVQELLDALDALAHALARQTAVVAAQGRAVRKALAARHERARGRARELRMAGGALVARASGQLRGRAVRARRRAQALRARFVGEGGHVLVV